ncbi:MAG: response regulator [Elusimicrobiota bacterium]|nr:response regulator [Elusimicrobiota bacterium]
MIVDDDALVRAGVRASLRGLCETVALSSGEELEEFLDNVRPELVILDVGLPDRDGFELCAALRAAPRWRTLPVLFLTAQDGDGAYERCLAVRGDGLLTKPVTRAELVDTVARLLPAR